MEDSAILIGTVLDNCTWKINTALLLSHKGIWFCCSGCKTASKSKSESTSASAVDPFQLLPWVDLVPTQNISCHMPSATEIPRQSYCPLKEFCVMVKSWHNPSPEPATPLRLWIASLCVRKVRSLQTERLESHVCSGLCFTGCGNERIIQCHHNLHAPGVGLPFRPTGDFSSLSLFLVCHFYCLPFTVLLKLFKCTMFI